MGDFDWIEKIPPKVWVGMRFTIPENESFKKPFTVFKIEGGEVHIVNKGDYLDFTFEIDEKYANKMVKEGVWKLGT